MADEKDNIERRREKARERSRRWVQNHPEHRPKAYEAVKRYAAKNPMLVAFWKHRNNAKFRGIEFLLSYEEWCDLWISSGKWEQRGNRQGQYVMARFGDQGPYAVDNVAIIFAEANNAEANLRKIFLGKTWVIRDGKRVWVSRERT